ILTEANDREMLGVLERNLGRVALDENKLGWAIHHLELAMDVFSNLELIAEEAEAVIFHAQSLARLGESDAARQEAEWALETLAKIGARSVRQEVEDFVREIGREGVPR